MSNFDLEERTEKFAINVRRFLKTVDSNFYNDIDCKQVVRSSGSIGANFIEASERTGPKDLKYRLRIAKKEVKETAYWLRIIKSNNHLQGEIDELIDEAEQLKRILITIISKIK